MSVDDAYDFPDEGPFWTAAEGEELLCALEAAFPDRQVPDVGELVRDPRHSDAGAIIEACAGHWWRSLSAESLWRAQDFWGVCTESGYTALLPAYVRGAITNEGQMRLELEGLACVALSPKFQGAERLSGRLSHFTPRQLEVLHRFLELRNRLHTDPPWRESKDGVFWRDYLGQRGSGG